MIGGLTEAIITEEGESNDELSIVVDPDDDVAIGERRDVNSDERPSLLPTVVILTASIELDMEGSTDENEDGSTDENEDRFIDIVFGCALDCTVSCDDERIGRPRLCILLVSGGEEDPITLGVDKDNNDVIAFDVFKMTDCSFVVVDNSVIETTDSELVAGSLVTVLALIELDTKDRVLYTLVCRNEEECADIIVCDVESILLLMSDVVLDESSEDIMVDMLVSSEETIIDKLLTFKVDNEGVMEVLVSARDKLVISPNSSLLNMPEPLSIVCDRAIDNVIELDETEIGSCDEFRLNVCETTS